MAAIVDMLGDQLEGVNGTVSTESICGKGKVVGFYFSAHWCPPCRGFTPDLAQWYQQVQKTHKDVPFEIVFISSDRDEAGFKEYFKDMPWLALPYQDRERKAKLAEKFGVRGIPTFVLLDGENGAVIKGNARSDVMNDLEGDDFPYRQ